MPRLRNESLDRMADYFVNYLFDEYKGTRHVRRVAAWVGLIVLGIGRVADRDWKVPRSRQLEFVYRSRRFKAKYDHRVGARGGIRVVEVLPGRGSPEGDTVLEIASLRDAGSFYAEVRETLDEFIDSDE